MQILKRLFAHFSVNWTIEIFIEELNTSQKYESNHFRSCTCDSVLFPFSDDTITILNGVIIERFIETIHFDDDIIFVINIF